MLLSFFLAFCRLVFRFFFIYIGHYLLKIYIIYLVSIMLTTPNLDITDRVYHFDSQDTISQDHCDPTPIMEMTIDEVRSVYRDER
jgi:hypothetical protein